MRISSYLVAGALVALASSDAAAGGLSLNDFGARASGRGTAMAGVLDDPSAIFFNPANMAFMPGFSFDLGLGAAMPKYGWETLPGSSSPDSAKTGTVAVPIPWLSAIYTMKDVGGGDLALGFGFYVPLGSGFKWPADWAGDQQVRQIDLRVFDLNPSVAYKIADRISIGGGINYFPCSVFLSKAVQFGSEAKGLVEMQGTGSAWGWDAGITAIITEGLSAGFSYRKGPTLKLSGDAQWNFPPPYDNAGQGNKVDASIGTADFYRLGFDWEVLPKKVHFGFDVERQTWSNLKQLTIKFTDDAGTVTDASEIRNNKDTWALHFGLEGQVTDDLSVRVGYLFDQHALEADTVNPAPPDSDQHVVSLGLSYALGNVAGMHGLAVTAYFENVFLAKRTTASSPFPGTYTGGYAGSSDAYLFGLGVTGGIDFGGAK